MMYNFKSEPLGTLSALVIMMRQWRFMSCDKYTTLVSDVDNGWGYLGVWAAGVLEISVPSSQFFWNLQLP